MNSIYTLLLIVAMFPILSLLLGLVFATAQVERSNRAEE